MLRAVAVDVGEGLVGVDGGAAGQGGEEDLGVG